MKAPLWVLELATGFWDRAQKEEPFPRNLRGPAVPHSRATWSSYATCASSMSWAKSWPTAPSSRPGCGRAQQSRLPSKR